VSVSVNGDLGLLLDIVACPSCRSALIAEPVVLRCTGCGRGFSMRECAPALLDEEHGNRERPVTAILHTLLRHPRVYDFHQEHGGGRDAIGERVRAVLAGAGPSTVLDLGAGTGMVAAIAPAGTDYIWLDNDPMKLRGFLSKRVDCLAVVGDVARLPIRDNAVDWTVMVEVSHHLPPAVFASCLDEAVRVTRSRLLFVDAVRGPRLRSRLLWQLDLGRFPRTETELLLAIEARFEIETVERFRINHDHLLCVCAPHEQPFTRRERVSS
jgi:SAM-dependent methyltransferase